MGFNFNEKILGYSPKTGQNVKVINVTIKNIGMITRRKCGVAVKSNVYL
jgi:hypothetical protein